MRAEMASWKRYRERLGRVPAKTRSTGSFIAYEQMEVDAAIAFIEEFRDHLRTHRPSSRSSASTPRRRRSSRRTSRRSR